MRGVVLALLFGVACSGAPGTRSTGGAELWSNHCVRCHNVRTPSSLSDAEWETTMQHMRARGNLTGEETRAVLEFLKSGN